MRSRFFLATLLSFGLVGTAAAHTIWVEREGDGARLYFGVPGPLARDDSIVAENVVVTERRGDKPTKVLNRLGARTVADFKEQAPANTLDIVPAGKPGLFKVFYQ